MAALARLVLDKTVLVGLKVAIWDSEAGGGSGSGAAGSGSGGGAYREGLIEAYSPAGACYIVLRADDATRAAVQFHEFTVEEEEGAQLVLKVSRCAAVPLPAGFAPAEGAGDTAAAAAALSTAPSSAASEQLSDVIGASFSHTDDGFAAVVPSGLLSRRLSGVGGASTAGAAAAAAAAAAVKLAVDVVAGAEGDDTADAATEPDDPSAAAAAAAPSDGEAAPSSPVPVPRPFGDALLAVATAGGDLGDGDGYWGTPTKEAPAAHGAAGTSAAAAALAWHTQLQPGGGRMRGAADFDQIARMIAGGGERPGGQAVAAPVAPAGEGTLQATEEGDQEPRPLKEAQPERPQLPPRDPAAQAPAAAAVGDGTPQGDLPIAAALADAAGAGGGLVAESSSEFTIGTMLADEAAPDVGPRPPSGRSSWRASRTAIDQEVDEAEGEPAGAPLPPIPTRRASRTSARNLTDDPASSNGAARPSGAGVAPLALAPAAAGGSSAGASGSVAVQPAGPPLPAGSRRTSRAASARGGGLDQGLGFISNGGAAGPAAVPAAGEQQQYVPGAPLHVPGPVSRRTSRTLSGRLPPDQEPPPIAMAALAEAEADQDVPPRPQGTTSAAGALPSRRASRAAASGRGTPDSDGFGYSGFEEDLPEPILSLEELQRRSTQVLSSDAGTAAPAQAADPAAVAGVEGTGANQRGPARMVSDLLQAAAAAAVAAESYIGRQLSGGASSGGGGGGSGAGSSGGRGSASGAEAPEAPAAPSASVEGIATSAVPAEPPEPVFGDVALGGSALAGLRAAGGGDSFAISSVDSFTCPPVFPFGGGSGASGSAPGSPSGAAALSKGSATGSGLSLLGPQPSALGLSPLAGPPVVTVVAAVGDGGSSFAGPAQQALAEKQQWGQQQQQQQQQQQDAEGPGAPGPAAVKAKANPFAGDDEFGLFAGPPFGGGAGTSGGGSTSSRIGTRVVRDSEAASSHASGSAGGAGDGSVRPSAGGVSAAAAGGSGGSAAVAAAAVKGQAALSGLSEITPASESEDEADKGPLPWNLSHHQQQQQEEAQAVASETPPVRAVAALDAGAAVAAAATAEAAAPGSEAPGLVMRRAGSARLRAALIAAAQQELAREGQERRALEQQRAAFGGTTLIGAPCGGYDDEDSTAPLVAHHAAAFSVQAPAAVEEAEAQAVGRVVLDALAANGAQYYDAAAFGLMAPQLGAALMPAGTAPVAQLKAAFALFAAGHAARPLAALLWPPAAARLGRPAAVAAAAALAAFPAALAGAVPTYAQAGYVGLGTVAALRVLQGAAVGTDLAGPAVFLSERARQRPGLHASLAPAAAAAGAAAAAAACLFLAAALTPAALALWGWRVPLVLSLLVNGGQVVLRLAVLRDPWEGLGALEAADCAGQPLGRVLRDSPGRVLAAAALGALPAAAFYLLAVLPPAYLIALTHLAPLAAFATHAANAVLLAAAAPAGGWLADAFGRRRVLLGGAGAAAALAYPAWLLMLTVRPAAVWAGQALAVVACGLVAGAAADGQVAVVPKGARVTGLTLALALAGALGAAAPLAAVALAGATAAAAGPALVLIVAALISGAAAAAMGPSFGLE